MKPTYKQKRKPPTNKTEISVAGRDSGESLSPSRQFLSDVGHRVASDFFHGKKVGGIEQPSHSITQLWLQGAILIGKNGSHITTSTSHIVHLDNSEVELENSFERSNFKNV